MASRLGPPVGVPPPSLHVRGLSVARGARTILRDVSFDVGAGEALILKGPNGAGKSTLLRTLAGFLAPATGEIVLTGTDGDTPRVQCCHFCGHLDGLKAQLTVHENLRFWASYLSRGASQPSGSAVVSDALECFRLDLLADVPAAYLSAGQKRRLGLARLLVAQRPLWLLDEPTVSLDASGVTLLMDVLTRHLRAGGLIVAATHLDMPLPSSRDLNLGSATTDDGTWSAGR